MIKFKLAGLVALLAVIWAVPSTAWADAKGDATLVSEKGKALYSVDHFVANQGTRPIVVSVKTNWVENLRPMSQVYDLELRPGEKKLYVTEHPPQTNFKAEITTAKYK